MRRFLFITFIIIIGLIIGIWNLSSKTHETSFLSKALAQDSGEGKGCLFCHEGIETISDRMQPFLIKSAQELYGKSEGFECAVCHEGNPGAKIKDDAHKGMFPNPSSMWVLHKGKGCAKCHDTKDSITTLMGKPLKDPVGGELMDPVYPSEISKYSRRDYTYRMARSLMSLETGKANKILSSNGVILKGTFPYANFDMDDPDGPVPTVGTDKYKEWVAKAIKSGFLKRLESVKEIPDFESGTEIFGDAEKAGFSDIHRKQCARCHVWGEGREKRGDLRAAGCASCHMLYGNDGKYEGGDRTISGNKSRPHPLRHQITNAIPAAQCTHCHTRGKRIGTSFVGMFEYDYERDGKAPPFDEHGKAQEPLYTKEYLHVREDVHFERGMDCADCHTSIDVHGDGNIYPATYYQVEVSCHDCHGTPDKYPWELPVGYGTPVQLGGERGIYKVAGDKSYLLTSRGNIKPNWRREENKAYVLSRYAGKKREIPLLKSIKSAHRFKTKQGKVAMSVVTRHMQKMECYACHSVWAPQCFGCHIQYDRRAKGTDWPNTSKNLDPVSGRQTITKSPGDLTVENRSFMRWENPILGINVKGKVSPLVPGCQVFYTFIDEKGEIKTSNKTYTTSTGHNSPTLAPLAPHSTTLAARTCEDCHTNPKAIGYGTGNSRSAQQILGNEPLFQNLSKGVYGDIPGAKTGKQQVPKIEKFPYALDQLITRDGKQIQNMPLPEDRPLDNQERNLVEREGLCIGCHQFYGTPEWTELRKKYGRAKTAEQHERIVSEILKSLMKKTK